MLWYVPSALQSITFLWCSMLNLCINWNASVFLAKDSAVTNVLETKLEGGEWSGGGDEMRGIGDHTWLMTKAWLMKELGESTGHRFHDESYPPRVLYPIAMLHESIQSWWYASKAEEEKQVVLTIPHLNAKINERKRKEEGKCSYIRGQVLFHMLDDNWNDPTSFKLVAAYETILPTRWTWGWRTELGMIYRGHLITMLVTLWAGEKWIYTGSNCCVIFCWIKVSLACEEEENRRIKGVCGEEERRVLLTFTWPNGSKRGSAPSSLYTSRWGAGNVEVIVLVIVDDQCW